MTNTNSMFDPTAFLETTIEGELSTSVPACPDMEDALCLIKSIDIRIQPRPNEEDAIVMDVTCVVDEEEAREVTGMKEPQVRHGVFLEITPDGALDTAEGKNVSLGRLREAVGQNSDAPWAPNMLIGQVFRAVITQQPSKKEGDDRVFNRLGTLRAA